jgi:hypothetical protein
MALALAARKPMPQFGGAEMDSTAERTISHKSATPSFAVLTPAGVQTH